MTPGCYGLRLEGLPFPAEGLVDVPDDAPRLRVRHAPALHDLPAHERAEVLVLLEGHLALTADAALATYVVPSPPSADELLHPWLAQAAINRSLALGRLVLHGGLLSGPAGAVAVVGHREAGKSTLMAQAAIAGVPVLSDDVVVLDGADALTGPRCVDLRPGTAEHLRRAGRDGLLPARGGTRWRLALPAAPWRVPLAGVVVLDWGADLERVRVPPAARLGVLAPHLACAPSADARRALLAAAEVPVHVLRRPRDFRLLQPTLDLTLST